MSPELLNVGIGPCLITLGLMLDALGTQHRVFFCVFPLHGKAHEGEKALAKFVRLGSGFLGNLAQYGVYMLRFKYSDGLAAVLLTKLLDLIAIGVSRRLRQGREGR